MVGKSRVGIRMAISVVIILVMGSALTIAPQRASASPSVSISSISVSGTCGTSGGFTGTVTLSGNASATVTLGLFYHIPGNSAFFDSGLRTTAVFSNSSTATYSFGSYTNASANTYRIQVTNSGGLGGSTVKSNSVPPCTGTLPPPPPCNNPNATGPSVLGLCTQGSTPDTQDSGSPNGSQITTGNQAETVSSMCGDVVAVDPNLNNRLYSFAIYNDAGGVPGTILATSGVGTMTAAGWNCLPITATLQPNTTYWLEFYSNAADGNNADPSDPPTSYGDLYYNVVSQSNAGAWSYCHQPAGNPINWGLFNPFTCTLTGPYQWSIFANVSP